MNAEELQMALSATDSKVTKEDDEEDSEARNNVAKMKETDTVEHNQSYLDTDNGKGTVNDQEEVRDRKWEVDKDTYYLGGADVDDGNGNTGQEIIKELENTGGSDTGVDECRKKDVVLADAKTNDKGQDDKEVPETHCDWNNEHTDEVRHKDNTGLARAYTETAHLTRSQDEIDKDSTYQDEGLSKLQKWGDMSDLQGGQCSGFSNYNGQNSEFISPIETQGSMVPRDTFSGFQSSGGIFSPTTNHRGFAWDQDSNVDYPEAPTGTLRQTSSPEYDYPMENTDNVYNTRNPLPTIQEGDSEEPHDEQNQGKEDGRVVLLKKGNIRKLLRHLLETKVLTEGEHRRCEAKPRREDMCSEVMKILQKKDGGEILLKQALKEVQVEEGHPKKVKVSSKKLEEKETEISRLKGKISELQKELRSKSEEIKDLKKVKPVNIVEPLVTTRDRNMIHTITERRRASRELEIQPNLAAAASEATQQLQQELDHLKQELMVKDKELEVVQNLKDVYPYISDVLCCPIFPIKLPDYDSTTPLYCPVIKLSLTNANSNACQVYDQVVLINEPSHNRHGGYRKYQGTSGSTPFLLPVLVSKMLPHPVQYWETHTRVSLECMILSFHTLFEIGLCEESIVDKMTWLYKSPRSWSIRIGICRNHHWGVCAQVYGSAAKHGLCYTHVMSNIPEKTSTLCYGIVLDVGTGKIGLIDIGKERVLHTFNVQFRENLYPMFGVQPLSDVCSIKMTLMSGDQVEMTEKKQSLIVKALSSKQ